MLIVKLADGKTAKVGLLVTNVPGKISCTYGGSYSDGKVGAIEKIVDAHELLVRFGDATTWSAEPSELISCGGAKLPAGFQKGDWVKTKSSHLGKIIGGYTDGAVVLLMQGTVHKCKAVDIFPIKYNLPPKLNEQDRFFIIEGRCGHCTLTGRCYLTNVGWLCKECFNSELTCYFCGIPIRRGRAAILSRDSYKEWCCSECFSKRFVKHQEVAKQFELDDKMWLAQAAADFYLSYLLKIETGDGTIFDGISDKLAREFSQYMFLAVGGELRHISWDRLRNLLKDELDYLLKKVEPYYDVAIWFLLAQITDNFSRGVMWKLWEEQSERFTKLKMVTFARLLFDVPTLWSDSLGGKSWRNIANVLEQYLSNGINKTIFVDTAFGLKHNCTLQFSKAWELYGLQKALEDNSQGNYGALFEIASEQVKEATKCLIKKQSSSMSVGNVERAKMAAI